MTVRAYLCGTPGKTGRPCGRKVAQRGGTCWQHRGDLAVEVGGGEVVSLRLVADSGPSMSAQLEATLAAAADQLRDADAAMVALARGYAKAIDALGVPGLESFGPKLRMTLQNLVGTPQSSHDQPKANIGGALERIRAARQD